MPRGHGDRASPQGTLLSVPIKRLVYLLARFRMLIVLRAIVQERVYMNSILLLKESFPRGDGVVPDAKIFYQRHIAQLQA